MYIVVFVTSKNKSEAKKISNALLKAKLVACSNIISGVESYFWWNKKIDKGSEVLLILKTKKFLLEKIVKSVEAHHSYESPEVIALPIVGGRRGYLKWIDESVKS